MIEKGLKMKKSLDYYASMKTLRKATKKGKSIICPYLKANQVLMTNEMP
jgi:hypothetical protein